MKLLILFFIASCSSYFPPIRGQYTLTTLKHFMVSNMYVNPSNMKEFEKKIIINYDVIVKNVDKSKHDIDLGKGLIRIKDNSYPMECHRFKTKEVKFSLDPGAQTRLLCQITLEKMQFASSDYQTILEIPLDKDLAKFEYLLLAKDFR